MPYNSKNVIGQEFCATTVASTQTTPGQNMPHKGLGNDENKEGQVDAGLVLGSFFNSQKIQDVRFDVYR